jgi:signal transduction histidine kinase
VRASRRPVPLSAWAGAVVGAAVTVTGGGAALALALLGRLDAVVAEVLAAGAAAGLAVAVLASVVAARFGTAVRALHADAVRRLGAPSAPDAADRSALVRGSSELAELADVLDALHQRIRLADEVAERHRREAETAGAGVFELVSGLVAAEEGARGQLAAELHDTVAQSLMIARGLLATNPCSDADLRKLGDYVDDAEEQVRAVMARTRPPALREGDLATAISGLQAEMLLRYGLGVHLSWPETPFPLPLASAITVYRFFQEALLNVVKHADVDDAALSLEVTGRAVVAVVRDQGPGFDPDLVKPDRGRHVGLGLLRERARLSGGTLRIESQPGDGTVLTLELPRSARVPRPQQAPAARRPAGLVPEPRAEAPSPVELPTPGGRGG